MSNWIRTRLDPEAELKAADVLLNKADALLRRHKGGEREPDVEVSLEEEELPVLTDVVQDFDGALPVLGGEVAASAAAPQATPPPAPDIEMAELLIDLDTEIAREVEAWFANELPQLLSRELDRLADRLRAEALAHLRATLLPALSQHISHRLEERLPTKR